MKELLLRFIPLREQLTMTQVDETWLARAERQGNVLPELNWRYWA